MKNFELWVYVIIFTIGVPLNQGGESQVPLNFNGSPRTACLENTNTGSKPSNRHDSSIILRQLRSEMGRMTSVQDKPLDGYIVTSDDDHQSSSVLTHYMRREFLTGFRGSSGEALVTANKAVLWTDGRYHIQADQELDCHWILMKYGREGVPSLTQWLKQEFKNNSNARIGADPKLVAVHRWMLWEKELAQSSIHLIAVQPNLIDLIWQVNRPLDNTYAAYELKTQWSGKPWQEKVHEVRALMAASAADALVLTALDDIAWLLNIRGWDLPNTPVLRAYAILTNRAIYLHTDRIKITRSLDMHLKTDGCFYADCVRLRNYTEIWNDLGTMSQTWTNVWLPAPCGYAQGVSRQIYMSIPSGKRLIKPSPIIELRAVKNDVEIRGMRKAHIRDAIAVCDFLADMEFQMSLDREGWDEVQVVRAINEYRLEMDYNQGISFSTIVGYGPHAAQPHYEPSDSTNLIIGRNSTLVIDSGGQYFDGTTDVTRTLHFGEPSEDQKRAYTRVLIGSIQLASLIFPNNLRTDQLDAFAREPLWNVGYDFMHGTGHGIGHFSSVHESPISISYMQEPEISSDCSMHLKPGYFFTNEPGYYEPGNFGVRLENVLEVVEAKEGDPKWLKFRDTTLIPYEPKLIELSMLSPSHRRWLNNYNKRIRDEVGAEMKRRLRMVAYEWMEKKTRSIPEYSEDVKYFGDSSSSSTNRSHENLIILISLYILKNGLTRIISP